MSRGDGTDNYTRLAAARHEWSLWPSLVVSNIKCRHFSRPRGLVKIYVILEAPGWSD
jgi:hypothetical protein